MVPTTTLSSGPTIERMCLKDYMVKENERFKLTQVVEREPKMSDYEKFVVDIAKKLG